MPKCAPYIYGLFDPREPGHIRYVGMTFSDSRPVGHGTSVLSGKEKPCHKTHWIQKLFDEGTCYDVKILEQLPKHSSVHFVGLVERMYIKSLREIGHNLTNVSDGGQGGGIAKGSPQPEGTRIALEQMRAKYQDENGSSVSTKTLAALSEANKHRVISDSQKQRLREVNTGKHHSAETRAKLSALWLGKTHTEETRAKMSESAYRRWHPEEDSDDPAVLSANIKRLKQQLAALEGAENAR